MKTFVLSLAGAAAAAALIASAIPPAAHAQIVTGEAVDANAVVGASGNWTLKERESWLSARLNMAHNDGTIGGESFDSVHHELGDLRADEDRMRDSHDGQLTDNETVALEGRLNDLADQLHWLRDAGFQRPW